MEKDTKKSLRQKYAGTIALGQIVTDQISKEEFAAIAFYLAQRISGEGNEIETVIQELGTLMDNQIIRSRKVNFQK